MRNGTKKAILFLLILSLVSAVMLAGCGKEGEGGNKEINFENNNITLALGERYTLVVKDSTGKIMWSSNNEDVAKVEDGTVIPVSVGVAIIKAEDDTSSALCRVEVVEKKIEKLLKIEPNRYSLTLFEGDVFFVDAKVLYEDVVRDAAIAWDSVNKAVATVNDGHVTAVSKGSTEIVARATVGGKSAETRISVTVLEREPILFFNMSNSQVIAGETLPLELVIMNGSDVIPVNLAEVELSVSDADLAEISAEGLDGKKKGYVTVYASYTQNDTTYQAEAFIRVRERYTVNYYVDANLVHSEFVLDGERLKSPLDAPTAPEGFMFRYWTKDKSSAFDFSLPIEENTNLYAKWLAPQMDLGDDYDLSVFGAYAVNGTTSVSAKKDTTSQISYTLDSSLAGEWNVYLPRVDYSKYLTVTFRVKGGGWFGFGYYGYNIAHDTQDGILTVTNNGNGTYTVNMTVSTMLFGNPTTYRYGGTLTLANDSDVILGRKGIDLLVHCYGGANKTITVGIPEFVTMNATMTQEDDYSRSFFGAHAENGQYTASPVNNGNNFFSITFDSSISWDWTVYLPRIKYSDYKKVTFTVTGGGWFGFGYGGYNIAHSDQNGTLEIVNNLDGTYTVSLTVITSLYGNPMTYTYGGTLDEDDMDIINGEVGISLLLNCYEGFNKTITVYLPEFTV